MHRMSLFSTPVWTEHLGELERYREGWVHTIRELRRAAPALPQGSSAHGGWQSDKKLLDRPDFAPLQQRLLQAVRAVLTDYGVKPGSLVLNLNGWANVHDRGGYNAAHVHPGCLVSGTVYLHAPPGAGSIFFVDPRPAAQMESFPRADVPIQQVSSAPVSISVEPANLKLVMFPSWLLHGVEPCGADERIGVAFNVEMVLAKAG